MIYDPIISIPWIVCIAIAMSATAIYYQIHSARHLGWLRSGFLLLLRLTAITSILLLLLQPSREEKVPVPAVKKSVIFAIDNSASMAAPHQNGTSRIDAVLADLEQANLSSNDDRHRFFSFSETAQSITSDSKHRLIADGKTTRIDTSVSAMLRMTSQPPPAALFIFSDGHDFDLIPPGETARRTRSRDLPIFTIPYGTADSARDVSIRIANYHPHTFARQKTRIEAFVRTVGCPYEKLTVDLLCDGKKVQEKTVETGTEPFQTVGFDVIHEDSGQYEYTYRITPVSNEREISNNSASTYLNVISERIRILEIEGTPFWDSTFLRRSFSRNDKFDIDSLVAFTDNRVKPIRSNSERSNNDLKPPTSIDDLKPYNIVIFGRDVERVIGLDGIRLVEKWVKDQGGILIFSRGQAWAPAAQVAAGLEPINWEINTPKGTRLEVTPQASSISAFRLLREVASADEFPEVITFQATSEPKTLASTFSVTDTQSPAVVYRRYGSGQTISLGVGNLWRWVFNPKADYDNNAYDRFWDELTLWLLANGGVTPLEGYSLRGDTSNLPIGETIHLRFGVHGLEPPTQLPTLTLFHNDIVVTNLTLTADSNPSVSRTEFTPKETGRYRAEVKTPDGKIIKTQFIVYREDMESTETAMDRTYLEQLAKTAGGRMLDPSEVASVVADILRDTSDQAPLTRRIPLWDRPWIYLLLCVLLGAEWHNRRRWGLT